MTTTKSLLALLVLFLFIGSCTNSKPTLTLPRSVPEAEGVSSADILSFLDAAEKSKHEFHSFMFLRHGKVIAEGWWNPYKPELKHTLYSTSKSFTSTAIGFAVNEKLLSLNDTVMSFFPSDLPDTISKNLASLTIKDLITMSAGQEPDPTFRIVSQDSIWFRSFLATPVVHKPGSTFLYNSLATYMLSAIVQKVTGQKVVDYLKPRLFDPLHIEGMDWETDPKGINTGGWGLRLKTEDMAKFGQLLLQKGKWDGKQVIPSSWVEEATTFKIDQAPNARQSQKDSSDWMQGYCYQFWRCRHNAFRADGAYGQYIIVMPDKDAVIAITSESPNMQEELDLVWKYLLPAIKDDKLPENKESQSRLEKKLASLALPVLPKSDSSPAEKLLAGKTIELSGVNDLNIKKLEFQFANSECTANFTVDSTNYTIAFAQGSWKNGETTMLGPSLLLKAKAHMIGIPASTVAGNYCWTGDTLVLKLRYIDSPHSENIRCWLNKDKAMVRFENSQDFGGRKTELVGILK